MNRKFKLDVSDPTISVNSFAVIDKKMRAYHIRFMGPICINCQPYSYTKIKWASQCDRIKRLSQCSSESQNSVNCR